VLLIDTHTYYLIGLFLHTLLIQNWEYVVDKSVINIEVSCSIFNIGIKDKKLTYFVSVEDLCTWQEYDQHVHHIFDLLYDHAFLKPWWTPFSYNKFYVFLPHSIHFK